MWVDGRLQVVQVRSSKRQRGTLTPVNLREVYAQQGEYTIKMMIDGQTSAGLETIDVKMRNADGTDIPMEFRRWGTKLTLSFMVNDSVPDGVVVIDVAMVARGKELKERFSCWIVK
jgi:hypothetical protein